jgi:CRISPR/Cas system-associated protein Cas10 (large subunit of type III CRISPR-Cas system)
MDKVREDRTAYFREYHQTYNKRPESRARRKELYQRPGVKEKNRELRIRRSYGLTLEAYQNLLESQGTKCAACGTSDWGAYGPMIDHDHVTGEVRGIVCTRCNVAIGHLKDSPQRARALAEYMEKYQNRRTL